MLARLRSLLVLAACLTSATDALAQGGAQGAVSLDSGAGGGISDGILLGSHMFFYSDNSSLGGDTLKDGSAVYTRFDAQYNWTAWFAGLGFFYEQDKFGADQADTIMGPVIELVLGSFFVKIMPGQITQSFTGRSFTERTGSYMAFEGGIRANLVAGLLFYEVTLHRRTQTITQEDGRAIADVYEKTETMPMLGMGVNL